MRINWYKLRLHAWRTYITVDFIRISFITHTQYAHYKIHLTHQVEWIDSNESNYLQWIERSARPLYSRQRGVGPLAGRFTIDSDYWILHYRTAVFPFVAECEMFHKRTDKLSSATICKAAEGGGRIELETFARKQKLNQRIENSEIETDFYWK